MTHLESLQQPPAASNWGMVPRTPQPLPSRSYDHLSKHLPHPAPPKPRGSKSETALEEMMDRRFEGKF